MLEVFLLVLFVSFVVTTLGLNLLFFFKKDRRLLSIDGEQLVLAFFLGLVAIALISSWINLFCPLSFWILSPIVLAACINLYANKQHLHWNLRLDIKKHKFEIIVFVISCILFIQLGSLIPYMPDTKTYHLQIVRWCQQFKTVPGLANLYPRYAFYSNWFHLVSILSFSPNQTSLLYVNTTLTIWFTFFLFIKILAHSKKESYQHRFLMFLYTSILLFMFIGWNLLRGNCQSLNNDFIVTTLSLYILLRITEKLILEPLWFDDTNILILLTASIPFFKLTGAFVLIALCIYLIQVKQLQKRLYFLVTILFCFGIPYLIKNYIQSGYIFFPLTFFDVFAPDWKLPREMADRFNEFILLSNQYIYESIPSEAWQTPSYNWLNTWYFKLATYDKVLLILYVATLPLLLFYKPFKQTSFRRVYPYLLLQVLFIILWFFTGPDPRFLYGYLLFATFTLISIAFSLLLKQTYLVNLTKLGFLTILLISVNKAFTYHGTFIKALPAESTSFRTVIIDNTSFIIPDTNRNTRMLHCEILPIPCFYQFNPYLHMRGENFKSGFRMNTPVDTGFLKTYIF
jgi:hypothetical protein